MLYPARDLFIRFSAPLSAFAPIYSPPPTGEPDAAYPVAFCVPFTVYPPHVVTLE
jgi:hypothetical protein